MFDDIRSNMNRKPMKEMDPSRSKTERASRLGGLRAWGSCTFFNGL